MTKRFQSAFDEWPDAVVLVDASGTIIRANQPALNLFGYSAIDLTGRTLYEVLPFMTAEQRAWIPQTLASDDNNDDSSCLVIPGITCVRSDGTRFTAQATFEIVESSVAKRIWIMFDACMYEIQPDNSTGMIYRTGRMRKLL